MARRIFVAKFVRSARGWEHVKAIRASLSHAACSPVLAYCGSVVKIRARMPGEAYPDIITGAKHPPCTDLPSLGCSICSQPHADRSSLHAFKVPPFLWRLYV